MKLALGSAQFGLDYGITNTCGKPGEGEIADMLLAAQAAGVTTIDTAALYGDAEAVLGRRLPRPHHFDLISKTRHLDPLRPLPEALANIQSGFAHSLAALDTRSLHGLLVHRVDDLFGAAGDKLWEQLTAWKTTGKVECIGASVYTPAEVFLLLERYPVDLVQLPFNVFDQRMLSSGALAALEKRGVTVHARSAFLQGVLLASSLPARLAALTPLAEAHRRFHEKCQEWRLGAISVALAALQSSGLIEAAVCGATSTGEAQALFAAARQIPDLPVEEFASLALTDESLIDPRRWPR